MMAEKKTTTKKTTTKKTTTKPKVVEPEVVEAVEETPVVEPEKVVVLEPAEPSYNEQIAEMQKMIAELQAQLAQKESQAPQVIQVVNDTEKVHFLFMAEVADDNVYLVGPSGMYGRVVGKTGTFFVPKSELSRVSDPLFRQMLDRRWIVVLDGLNEEERELWGVNYKEGELLDRRAFTRMIDLGDEIIETYQALCPDHKEMVAKRFAEAYAEAQHGKVKRETVVALNKMSDKGSKAQMAFAEIIEKMNEEDAK